MILRFAWCGTNQSTSSQVKPVAASAARVERDLSQRRRPVGPGLDDRADPVRRQVGDRRVVLGGEAHDLAPAGCGPGGPQRLLVDEPGGVPGGVGQLQQGGEAVLEDDDVVVGVGDLAVAVGGARAGRAQRARVGGREVGPVHPV